MFSVNDFVLKSSFTLLWYLSTTESVTRFGKYIYIFYSYLLTSWRQIYIFFYCLIYINVLAEFSYSCSTTQPGHIHTDNYTTTIPYGIAICRSWDSNSGVLQRLAVLPVTQLHLIYSTNSVTHWENATEHPCPSQDLNPGHMTNKVQTVGWKMLMWWFVEFLLIT